MDHVLGTRCLRCGDEQSFSLLATRCDSCEGNLEVVYDYPRIRDRFSQRTQVADKDPSLFRYLPLLPVDPQADRPPLAPGFTPLLRADRLGRHLGLARLMLKDEGRNPSGSLKDRASTTVLLGARAAGISTVVGASTGNAGSSMACLCASMGQRCVIFVPADAPQAKLAQILSFGALVVPVRGTYDQAFDLSLEVGALRGWYSRSTGFNPLTREGKKTCALEIWEQLGFRTPDWVFVSVGDGNILSGLHKGFRDLLALGYIEKLPRLGAVQAEGSAAVARTLARLGPGPTPPSSIEVETVAASTCADSISVDLPRDGLAAVRAVQESAGAAVVVSDADILEAIPLVAHLSGVFGEPAGVASVAGLARACREGLVQPGDEVVCVVTGSGLKDIKGALRAVSLPPPVEPTVEAVLTRLPRM